MRIGMGYDVHRLVEGRKLYIGGIEIPSQKGGLGHSDADVLIHTICDALLGAINQRDIGFHFPDTDAKYKNIDSRILLQKVIKLMKNLDYGIINIDSIVCLEKPKISKFMEKIQESLANLMKISKNQVSIKATTSENMGFIGKNKGISAHAVVLVQKTKKV